MRGYSLILAASLLLAPFSAKAQVLLDQPTTSTTVRETMEIGTSTSEIAITSDFTGADLTIFGALSNTDQLLLAIGQYDIVVVLEGPRENATVRNKER
ncbi:TIGR02186 family protein, partial [Rhizobium sp.]|uniref:TIGR02186 family protein n=1 Tax=Rhizobium sp. TaxID=391 RepID=UPI002F20AFAD